MSDGARLLLDAFSLVQYQVHVIAEIAAVHIRQVGRDPKKFDLAKIAKATNEFVGAEIESCVQAGMFASFYDKGREVTTKDIVQAAKSTVPLAKTMKEKINMIKSFGEERCRPASAPTKCKGEQFRRQMEG